jgi:hypothetical protein
MKRGMNFNNCLTIGANHIGLYMAMFPIFRIGHESLFIPWSEISATIEKGRFVNYIKFTFFRSPQNWIKISEKLSEKLKKDSGVELLKKDV